MKNQFSLVNKVAVVTGGNGILGTAFCKGLSEAGANVVVLGRKEETLQQVVSSIEKSGGEALGVQADVLVKDDLERAKSVILSKFGTIDILVNAAGGNQPGAVIAPDKVFFDLNIDAFKQVVDLNLVGTVLPSQLFGEVMAKSKRGVIINISSMAALRPITRVVGYSAAKAGVDNFTQWLAVELARKVGEGIRVNAIAPGFFLTEQNKNLLTNTDGSLTDRGKSVIQHTPFGRFGKPEELIGTLIWLCSDAASFVTGVTVPVDGGFNAFCGV
jgi:NAD(P)-dependent dehydrogenase (short-subunit alcohol dehydrogenase family)